VEVCAESSVEAATDPKFMLVTDIVQPAVIVMLTFMFTVLVVAPAGADTTKMPIAAAAMETFRLLRISTLARF
jgi:hypothetical protein